MNIHIITTLIKIESIHNDLLAHKLAIPISWPIYFCAKVVLDTLSKPNRRHSNNAMKGTIWRNTIDDKFSFEQPMAPINNHYNVSNEEFHTLPVTFLVIDIRTT